ncbi:MAG: bifunctional salicylyl-CoA 5-hydroxylase/oxidoreductase [Longimicrobiales bacterium]
MKVAVIGAGPAGLYLALLLKKANPGHRVTVLERNRPDDTFGWGVVFSDQTLANLRRADRLTHDAITDHFAHWDDIDVHIAGRTITSGGHGFSGIARKTLLRILQERAAELGVDLRFQCELLDDARLPALGLGNADLIVAADGANSLVRRKYADALGTNLDVRQGAKFIWLGTTLRLDAFTFIFIRDDRGVFQAHAYRFDDDLSTFIVECDAASWLAAGFDRMNADESVTACETMFAPWLEGHRLMANAPHQFATPWSSFVRVANERWHHGNVVLLGDAAHTAHFSIGSGTKLAMEDAIVLARELDARTSLEDALEAYQAERQTEALRLQNAARNSMEWFENVKRYIQLDPEQFAYSLLTRSQRVSHENLRLRDKSYLEGVERWFASRASQAARHDTAVGPAEAPATVTATPSRSPSRTPGREAPQPPMFTPFRLRGMVLENRVAVSPMDMYCADDGIPNDFHQVHLGGLALGGAALVFTEMTCVSPDARISLGCTGMYAPVHGAAWKRIVDFVHDWTPAKICFQVGHSGRKGSTKKMWEGMDEPLDEGNWDVIAPSALPWSPRNPEPRAMTHEDMAQVRAEFVRATEMAAACDFDMLELHCAHGYLLSSFITPLSNQRDDEYGGCLENRLRFPLEVLRAMRSAWPQDRPMSVRISATDWVERGIDSDEGVAIARAMGDAGADIIHVSTGQTSTESKPVYGRMFQTPFSDRIRNETGLPTIAVGNITEPDQVNAIIAAGRADICALARPHLADPRWTQHAAAELGYADQWWPPQYLTGKRQLERLIQRRREMERADRALREE